MLLYYIRTTDAMGPRTKVMLMIMFTVMIQAKVAEAAGWSILQRITSSNIDTIEYAGWWGSFVGVHNGTLVASSDGDTPDSNGALYMFNQNASTGQWSEQQRIEINDENDTTTTGLYCGWPLTMSGNNIMVTCSRAYGGAGAVYVVRPDADSAEGFWHMVQALTTPDSTDVAVQRHKFGYYMAIDGPTVVIADLTDDAETDGHAFVFVQNEENGQFEYVQELVPHGGIARSNFNRFGVAMAVYQSLIVVQAQGATNEFEDALFLYVQTSPTVWEQIHMTYYDNYHPNSCLGFRTNIVMTQTMLAVGRPCHSFTLPVDERQSYEDVIITSGAVMVYDIETGTGDWLDEPRQILMASDYHEFDGFGGRLDMTDSTLVVASMERTGRYFNSGAVYVFTKLEYDGDWVEVDIIGGIEDVLFRHFFGFSLHLDNSLVYIGTNHQFHTNIPGGKVYMIEIEADDNCADNDCLANQTCVDRYQSYECKDSYQGRYWNTFTLMDNSANVAADEHFGYQTAIDGSYIVVSAHKSDYGWYDGWVSYNYESYYSEDRFNSGQCIVYHETAPHVWEEVAVLQADVVNGGDWFGVEIDIENEVVIVGSLYDDDLGWQSGAAYIFQQTSPGSWPQIVKLVPHDFDVSKRFFFGKAVGLSNSTAVVGGGFDDLYSYEAYEDVDMVGVAYVYEETSPQVWEFIALLQPSTGDVNDYFGVNLAIDYSTVLVTAEHANVTLIQGGVCDVEVTLCEYTYYGESSSYTVDISRRGAVYVYQETTLGSWSETAILINNDLSNYFADSAAVSGSFIVVASSRGYVDCFQEIALHQWVFHSTIVGSVFEYHFGHDVKIAGDFLAVTSYGHWSYDTPAYVFHYDSNRDAWIERNRIESPVREEGSYFGSTIDVNNEGIVIVGSAVGIAFGIEIDTINDCEGQEALCLNGGVCIDLYQDFRCSCIPTRFGDVCEDCACANAGECISIDDNNEACVCGTESSFTGDLCEKECKNDGFGFGVPSKVCNCTSTGSFGPFCRHDIDDCLSNPCLNGGVCTDDGEESSMFLCSCRGTGYLGEQCNVLPCDSSPCLANASCTNGVNSKVKPVFECDCPPVGYEGDVCQTEIDECSSSPCMNNATCIDLLLGYDCDCNNTGWYGAMCELDVDDCASSPCSLNGKCKDKGTNAFKCNCDSGFTGDLCEFDVDDCLSSPCTNDGICSDIGTNAFVCDCFWPWKGTTCSDEMFPCNSNPCSNNAECTRIDEKDDAMNYGRNYTCKCDETLPYKGISCDVSCNAGVGSRGFANDTLLNYGCNCNNTGNIGELCDVTCNGGFTVQPLYGNATCNCFGLNSTGTYCNIPCENGGVASDGNKACDCPSGFTGQLCEFDIDDCLSNPCAQNGTCRDTGPDAFACDCDLGYYGELCDNVVDYCDPPAEATVGTAACLDDPDITCMMCLLEQSTDPMEGFVPTSDENNADNWVPNCYRCYGQFSTERQCIPASACYVEFQVSDDMQSVETSQQQCTRGYASLNSATCDICENNFFRAENGACSQCPNTGAGTWLFLLLIVLGIIALFIFISNFGAKTVKFISISFDFVQMVVLSVSVKLKWSKGVQNMADSLSVVMFSFDGFGGPSCMFKELTDVGSYTIGFLVVQLMPFIFMMMLAGVYYILIKILPFFRHSASSAAIRTQLAAATCWRLWSTFFMVGYLPVVQKAWAHFNCVKKADGSTVLASNSAISCDSKEWEALVPIAVIMIVLVGFGLPLVFFYIFCLRPHFRTMKVNVLLVQQIIDVCRPWLRKRQHAVVEYDLSQRMEYELALLRWSDKFSPLSLMFEADQYFWSLVQMMRAFCMANLSGVFRITQPELHALLLVMVNASFLYFHIKNSPYVSNTLDKLETSTGACTLFMLLSGLLGTALRSAMEVIGYIIIGLVSCILIGALILTVQAATQRKKRGQVSDSNRRIFAKRTFYPVIALCDCEFSDEQLLNDKLVYEDPSTLEERKQLAQHYTLRAASEIAQPLKKQTDAPAVIQCTDETKTQKADFFLDQVCAGQEGSSLGMAALENDERELVQSCQHVQELFDELTTDETLAGQDVREHASVLSFLASHKNPWVGSNDIYYLSMLLQLTATGKHIESDTQKVALQKWFAFFGSSSGLLLLLFAQTRQLSAMDVLIALVVGLCFATVGLKFGSIYHVHNARFTVQQLNRVLKGFTHNNDTDDDQTEAEFIWTKAEDCAMGSRPSSVYAWMGTCRARVFILHSIQSRVPELASIHSPSTVTEVKEVARDVHAETGVHMSDDDVMTVHIAPNPPEKALSPPRLLSPTHEWNDMPGAVDEKRNSVNSRILSDHE